MVKILYHIKSSFRRIHSILLHAREIRKRYTFHFGIILIIMILILFLMAIYMNLTNGQFYESLKNSPNKISIDYKYDKMNGTKSFSTVEIISEKIKQYNDLQLIQNTDKFGPLKNDSVIIIVQVHKRINYLKQLITSLSQAKEISKTLLIFSHDYYDEDINDLVQAIDFCKVLQIFFPYSIQTHEHEFPGKDPNDCPREIGRDRAISRKCNNALHPDLYGHYRESKFTQAKHHFWWKMNRVLDLDATQNHTGLVLFLEEDHYVAEDFLHVLNLMQRQAKKLCAKCNILSLGEHIGTFDYYEQSKSDEVESAPWYFGKHNMGFAFNRSTWIDVIKCSKKFCTHDDYNFDWSLQFLSDQCLPSKLHALIARQSRVFHIGACGLHRQHENCNSDEVISKVQNVLKVAKESHQIFPKSLKLKFEWTRNPTPLNPNGGWSDIRDHNLCLTYTTSNEKTSEYYLNATVSINT